MMASVSLLPAETLPLPIEYNLFLFPEGLGSRRASLNPSPYSRFNTFEMGTKYYRDSNSDWAEQERMIWIQSASYYKQKQIPQHEFIIFSIKSINGSRNCIALDRVAESATKVFAEAQDNRHDLTCHDYFYVSHSNDLGTLINHCGSATSNDQCMHVEKVTFEDGAFLFVQLIDLAVAISSAEPNYGPNTTNSYWFSGLAWECMLKLSCHGIQKHKKCSDERGRLRGVRVPIQPFHIRGTIWRSQHGTAGTQGPDTDGATQSTLIRNLKLLIIHGCGEPEAHDECEKKKLVARFRLWSRIECCIPGPLNGLKWALGGALLPILRTTRWLSARDSPVQTEPRVIVDVQSNLITSRMLIEDVFTQLVSHGCSDHCGKSRDWQLVPCYITTFSRCVGDGQLQNVSWSPVRASFQLSFLTTDLQ
ncbi:hypothetical protein ACGC1H_002396 [Rhizoctonia solani]